MTPAGFPHSEILGYSACLAAPRGLSQPAASFFVFWCQGIHRWLLVAWKIENPRRRARYAVLKVPEGQSDPEVEQTPSRLNSVYRRTSLLDLDSSRPEGRFHLDRLELMRVNNQRLTRNWNRL